MPSTYTLNNGIELIGTGEQSGTWGDTTNTNLELLDSALDGQVTVTLASAGSSGSPNALPISDGAASNGRNRMVVFDDSSDLGATAYVQLTPNDAEKIIYIRNDLSGSRSIILFQGTYNASNDYEVPAGTTAVVYFDGAGSGAVAANVFNNAYFDSLRLGGVSVTAILDEDNMASDSATALATQQSIKAYVDATAAAQNELSEVLANGNTTGGTDIAVSSGDDITFADSSKAIFGAGSDLQIYHDGDNSYIQDAATGSLILKSNNILLTSPSGESMMQIAQNDFVKLFHDNAVKLSTTATGIDVTGNANFADNGKAIFGAGSDLQIYHDGSHSWVKDVGTGDLTVSGDNLYLEKGDGTKFLYGVSSTGQVRLYYGDDQKFITTSTGIDVTGTVTADGLTVDGQGIFTTSDNNAQVTLISTDTDALVGPQLNLWRNSGTGSNGDLIGQITFTGEDTVGSTNTFASIYSVADQTNNGSEDGSIHFQTLINGVLADRLEINSTGNSVFTGTVTADGLTVDGDVLLNGDRDLHLVGSNPNAGTPFQYGEITLGDANTGQYNNHAKIVSKGNFANQTSLEFHTSDNNSSPLRMEISKIGDITFYDTSGNASFVYDESAGSTFNEQGADRDFRVESNSNTNMLFVDAGTSKVGVGTGSPDVKLHVQDGISGASGNTAGQLFVEGSTSAGISIGSATTNSSYIWFGDSDNIAQGRIRYDNQFDKFEFRAANVEDVLVLGGSAVVVNEESYDFDFRVESNVNTHALFVDGGNNRVGVGTSSPTDPFHVKGTSAFFGPDTTNYSKFSAYAGLLIGGNGAATREVNVVSNDTFLLKQNNAERIRLLSSGVVINEQSDDADFRVESDVNTHALLVDGGNGRVGFGCSDVVDARVNIQSTGVDGTYDSVLSFQYSGNSNETNRIGSSVSGTAANSGINFLVSDGAGSTVTRETLRLTRAAAVFNENGEDRDFRVESDSLSNMFYIDAGNNAVNINSTTTDYMLAVQPDSTANKGVTRFQRDRAARIHTFGGSAGGATKTVTIDFGEFGLTGSTITVEISGHKYNSGLNVFYIRRVFAVMEESGSLRISNDQSSNLGFSLGNQTGKVGSSSVTSPGGGNVRMTFTVDGEYDTKIYAKIEGVGASSVNSISVA